MPSVETFDLKQKAVLWAANGVDNYGEPKVKAPVEIRVRWPLNENLAGTPTEEPEALTGTVRVDRQIAPNSILWLGALADLPDPTEDLCVVVGYREVPDVKGRNPRRSVTIAKYSDSLPTVTS